MAKTKKQAKPLPAFKFLMLPAALLAHKGISPAEKIILADIRYFKGTYNFSYTALACKFGLGKNTIVRAIENLNGNLGMIAGGGKTKNRGLKLTEAAEKLFDKMPKPKKPKNPKPFIKPGSVLEVVEYAVSIDYEIDGQRFIDWYEERDWCKKGGGKLTSWKAAVKTWKARDNQNVRPNKISQSAKPESFIR